MVKVFNAVFKDKLDNPKRREEMPPETILQQLGLAKEDMVLDIGAGIGYFSIPMGKIVGKSGKVIAVDISKEMLIELKKRAEKEKLINIEIEKSTTYKIPIENNYASFTLLSLVIHEVEDKNRFLKEISRLLKDNGKIAIIEWKKKEEERGPNIADRLTIDEIESLLKNNHFKLKRYFIINDSFIAYLGEKIS